MISTIQLEYLVAVDTYRHFSTAAEKCFVTQPTLSMQLKKLEETLGVILFDRSKHPIIPTIIGQKVIEQARITLSELRRIEAIVEDSQNALSGQIRIGIIPSLAPYLMPLFIGRFTSNYPDVHLKATEMLTEDIITGLKKEIIDVGLLVTPLKESGIFEVPLFYEKMMLYSHNDHQLAHKKVLKSLDIASPDLWLLSKGHCFRSQVINLCSYQENARDELTFEYESGSLETLKRLVQVEGGYTLLPELALDDTLNSAQTTVRELERPHLREVSLVHTRSYAKKSLLEALTKVISESVPQKMRNPGRGQIVEWRR